MSFSRLPDGSAWEACPICHLTCLSCLVLALLREKERDGDIEIGRDGDVRGQAGRGEMCLLRNALYCLLFVPVFCLGV